MIEVFGTGGLTVLDTSKLEHSSMASARVGQRITLLGVRTHILLEGDRYDLRTHTAHPGSK